MGERRERWEQVVVVEVLQTYRVGWLPVAGQTSTQAPLISLGHPCQAGPSLGRAQVLPPQGRVLLF